MRARQKQMLPHRSLVGCLHFGAANWHSEAQHAYLVAKA